MHVSPAQKAHDIGGTRDGLGRAGHDEEECSSNRLAVLSNHGRFDRRVPGIVHRLRDLA